MLFDRKYYYKYICSFETISFVNYLLIIIFSTFLGFLISHIFNINILLFSLLFMLLGVFLGYIFYENNRIKVEEMKMKLDIYDKIINSN